MTAMLHKCHLVISNMSTLDRIEFAKKGRSNQFNQINELTPEGVPNYWVRFQFVWYFVDHSIGNLKITKIVSFQVFREIYSFGKLPAFAFESVWLSRQSRNLRISMMSHCLWINSWSLQNRSTWFILCFFHSK